MNSIHFIRKNTQSKLVEKKEIDYLHEKNIKTIKNKRNIAQHKNCVSKKILILPTQFNLHNLRLLRSGVFEINHLYLVKLTDVMED